MVAVDLFFLTLGNDTYTYLNVIDHGTNLQQCALVDHDGKQSSAQAVWQCFSDIWIRAFGAPEILLSDGGPEFDGEFSRRFEQLGVLQHVCDAESPWQNGRCERHGGLVKDLLEKGVYEQAISNLQDLICLSNEVVAAKNKFFHRGGFSPYQLVFGQNPHLPCELISDDPSDMVGLENLQETAADADSAAAQFARSHQIRRAARKLLMESG